MPVSLRTLLEDRISSGVVPGAIAAHGRDLDPIVLGSAAPGGPPLAADGIVRIQSMTKAITAVAALRLVEQGVLSLDAPLGALLPELAAPLALPHPDAPLEQAAPSRTPLTLRHLLTCTAGIGVMTSDSPLARAMEEAGLAAGAEPPDRDADAWLAALAQLPLAFEPGTAWRYHHSFGVLGILLGRAAGTSTAQVLEELVLGPAGMVDTGFTVPAAQAHRLLPALRRSTGGFDVVEAGGPGGPHVAPARVDLSHGELVSTLADLHRFLRALVDGELLGPELLAALRTDQVPAAAKDDASFFPGFWEGAGWGFGVSVVLEGPHAGRFGWSGGLGTDMMVDPDGTICLMLAQVEMDDPVWEMIGALQDVSAP